MVAAPNLKKKVLFVDDETILLDLYPLAFETEQDRWDIHVAPGGREALALMEEGPMDVIVSDMRMPGMDGAQLLQEVVRRHPWKASANPSDPFHDLFQGCFEPKQEPFESK